LLLRCWAVVPEEDTVKRVIAGFVIVLSIVVTGRAYAQETSRGPGKAEVTIISAGWKFLVNAATDAFFSSG
jgi:hypothetical protein